MSLCRRAPQRPHTRTEGIQVDGVRSRCVILHVCGLRSALAYPVPVVVGREVLALGLEAPVLRLGRVGRSAELPSCSLDWLRGWLVVRS